MSDLDYAKRILVHYFKLALPRWDSDNQAEIEAAIDSLVSAAKEEIVKEIDGKLVGAYIDNTSR